MLKKIEKISLLCLLLATLIGSNYPSRTNFHGPKGVRVIEVRLYVGTLGFPHLFQRETIFVTFCWCPGQCSLSSTGSTLKGKNFLIILHPNLLYFTTQVYVHHLECTDMCVGVPTLMDCPHRDCVPEVLAELHCPVTVSSVSCVHQCHHLFFSCCLKMERFSWSFSYSVLNNKLYKYQNASLK